MGRGACSDAAWIEGTSLCLKTRRVYAAVYCSARPLSECFTSRLKHIARSTSCNTMYCTIRFCEQQSNDFEVSKGWIRILITNLASYCKPSSKFPGLHWRRARFKAHPAVPGRSICSMRVPCAGDQRRAGGDMRG